MSPTYNLSKYLANCLSNIIHKNKYYIKDSFQLHEFLQTQKVPENYVLLSLDVISLFTNIPTELVIQIIEKKWPLIKKHTNLPLNEFINALKIVLDSTFFQYNNQFYIQHFGTAMGSPLSSITADIVMEELEETIVPKINNLAFFKRYVDDCLLRCHSDQIDSIVEIFNQYHPRIKFTKEIASKNKINYLDMTLIKTSNGTIHTSWFTKKIWTGRYIQFNSTTPFKYKISVLNSLVDRAVRLSHNTYRKSNLTKVRNTLKMNGYPDKILNKYINKRIKTLNIQKQTTNNPSINKENIKYASIVYYKNITERIEQLFRNETNIILAPKSNTTLGKNIFSNPKQKVATNEKSNVVYKIDCTDCNKTYIGQTKNHLKNRRNNHKNDIKRGLQNTALATHTIENLHKFNFDKTKILTHEQNKNKRLFFEMAEILKHNTVNFKTDINNLSQIYHNIIKN